MIHNTMQFGTGKCDLKEGNMCRPPGACFVCAYNLLLGSESGTTVSRAKNGEINDPRYDKIMCLRNPVPRDGRGQAVTVCDHFKLDRKRYHDFGVPKYAWILENNIRMNPQTKLEAWL